MNQRKKAATIFGILALAWIAVLFYFSGQDGVTSEHLSLRFAEKISKWFPWLAMDAVALNPILRKLAHVAIFAVEGFLMGLCLMNAMRCGRGAVLSITLCAMMAAANEYHQTFAGGRSCSLRDILIDSAGALLGIAVAALLIAIARHAGSHKKALQRESYRTGD